ncbi:MAG: family 20 glycosylhydrolase [Bacteroidales bacterium]|nr:family 20 glycosylhydrolase [Bacteroidales bacterium]
MKRFFCVFLLMISMVTMEARPLKDYLTPIPKSITMLREKNNFSNDQIIRCQQYLLSLHKNKISRVENLNPLPFLSFEIDSSIKPQAYILRIHTNKIEISGGDRTALFYASQTLLQVIDYSLSEKTTLPCLIIHDTPDFERRGYMLDISRNKVPKMSTLYKIVDLLASWKVNEFQLYTEHTFAYKNHKDAWEGCSPMTPAEIRELDNYCKERFIDLVPNQNSFGHMENWLRHDRYKELAECPDDCATKWGSRKLTSLDPTNPKSFELMQELYAELLPNFSSQYFNIGCDETVELGLGNSKALCDSLGIGQVYLDYLTKLNNEVNELGHTTMFWGDIVLNHKDLIPQIPQNVVAMVGGCDRDYAFNKALPDFQTAGLEFYVCPGTSTWRSLIGRNNIAFANIYNAAHDGKKYGAKGLLLTNWGDYGHWQPLSVCHPAMLIGTSYAWNLDTSALDALEFQLNHYIFKDKTGNTAKALLLLGQAHEAAQIPEGVANVFHLMLHRYQWTIKGNYQTREMRVKPLTQCEKMIDSAVVILNLAQPMCNDAKIVMDELRQAANLAKHGVHLGIARLNTSDGQTKSIPTAQRKELANELKPLIDNHKKLWTVRNREGGLSESAGRLQEIYDYYLDLK